MQPISIPQTGHDFWEGTRNVSCHCGGQIVWAEAGYAPGSRACRSCLTLFQVRGEGESRRLVPQPACQYEGVIVDADESMPDSDLYKVPENLYPGFYEPVDEDPREAHADLDAVDEDVEQEGID